MANKNDLFDFDATTATNNDNIQGANIAEGCLPGGINNAIRGLASIVKRALGTQGSAIASAGTTDIGAAGTALYTTVTGVTTITALGTVGAGTFRIVEFTGILTLTHNATSLILPGGVSITTAAGDVAFLISLGSGNWKCLNFSPISGTVVGGFSSVTATSTDAGATEGPDFKAFRNSASPADNDLIGRYLFNGRNESSAEVTYASAEAQILDATGSTEDALLLLKTIVAGTLAARVSVGQGVQIGSPTGGDPGANKINATAYKVEGVELGGLPLQTTYYSVQGPQSAINDVIPADDTGPLVTEGAELFSRAFTPKLATGRLRFDINVTWGTAGGAGTDIVFALFSGSTLIAAWPDEAASTGGMSKHFVWEEVSASLIVRTYSLRYGPATATNVTINLTGAGDDFGDKLVSSMTITERLP